MCVHLQRPPYHNVCRAYRLCQHAGPHKNGRDQLANDEPSLSPVTLYYHQYSSCDEQTLNASRPDYRPGQTLAASWSTARPGRGCQSTV